MKCIIFQGFHASWYSLAVNTSRIINHLPLLTSHWASRNLKASPEACGAARSRGWFVIFLFRQRHQFFTTRPSHLRIELKSITRPQLQSEMGSSYSSISMCFMTRHATTWLWPSTKWRLWCTYHFFIERLPVVVYHRKYYPGAKIVSVNFFSVSGENLSASHCYACPRSKWDGNMERKSCRSQT